MSTSQAQLEANRRNAALSTGPVTVSGKQTSSRNSQGPIARFLLSTENAEEIESMKADLAAEFNPQSAIEHSYLAEMALARVRMLRYAEFEASLIETALEEKRTELGPTASETKVQAQVIRDLIDKSKTLNTLHRYQRDHARAFERAADKLNKAKAERLEQSAQQDDIEALDRDALERAVEAALFAPIPGAAKVRAEMEAEWKNEPNISSTPRKLTQEEQAKLALRL